MLLPIANSYADCLLNSTDLINTLEELVITEDVTLVSLDVIKLFPSIPQEECLEILYSELQSHSDLLLFDPNLLMQLTSIHLRNNFFQFGNFTFQQTTGIAMGAAFSPSLANIYMSVFLIRFLKSYPSKPLLLKRYIDDIFIIWPNRYKQLCHSSQQYSS